MCGITGHINFSSKNKLEDNVLKEMISTMIHRGPDDSGIYVDLNKSEGLVNAIKSFYEDESLRKKYGRLAYNNSFKYSWDTTTKKTIEFVIKNYERANLY